MERENLRKPHRSLIGTVFAVEVQSSRLRGGMVCIFAAKCMIVLTLIVLKNVSCPDHPEVRKNFYIEHPDTASRTPSEVEQIRRRNNNITVEDLSKGSFKPHSSFFFCRPTML